MTIFIWVPTEKIQKTATVPKGIIVEIRNIEWGESDFVLAQGAILPKPAPVFNSSTRRSIYRQRGPMQVTKM